MPVDMRIPVQCLQSVGLNGIDNTIYFVNHTITDFGKTATTFRSLKLKSIPYFFNN